MASRFPLIASTDIVGAFGDPNDVIPFWEQILGSPLPPYLGFELISFKLLWPRASSELKSHLAGIHGRTHTFPNFSIPLVLHLVNQLISTHPNLLTQANSIDHPIYILQHSPILKNLLPLPPSSSPHLLVVENDKYPSALKEACSLSQQLGPKNLVCDLYHLLEEVKSFSAVLAAFKEVAPHCHLIHIPIGTRSDDSLPMDTSESFLTQIGDIISQHSITPVIECQWGGVASIHCRPHTHPIKVDYLHRWFDKLVRNDVIKI